MVRMTKEERDCWNRVRKMGNAADSEVQLLDHIDALEAEIAALNVALSRATVHGCHVCGERIEGEPILMEHEKCKQDGERLIEAAALRKAAEITIAERHASGWSGMPDKKWWTSHEKIAEQILALIPAEDASLLDKLLAETRDRALEEFLCPVHANLDKADKLAPFDNCIACIRNERDELRALKRQLDERDAQLLQLQPDWPAIDMSVSRAALDAHDRDVQFDEAAIAHDRWWAEHIQRLGDLATNPHLCTGSSQRDNPWCRRLADLRQSPPAGRTEQRP